jgi:hypothetical protein
VVEQVMSELGESVSKICRLNFFRRGSSNLGIKIRKQTLPSCLLFERDGGSGTEEAGDCKRTSTETATCLNVQFRG